MTQRAEVDAERKSQEEYCLRNGRVKSIFLGTKGYILYKVPALNRNVGWWTLHPDVPFFLNFLSKARLMDYIVLFDVKAMTFNHNY